MSCILSTEIVSQLFCRKIGSTWEPWWTNSSELTGLTGYKCHCSAKDFPKQVTSGWVIKGSLNLTE